MVIFDIFDESLAQKVKPLFSKEVCFFMFQPRIISFFNQAGGVGKSTYTMNLGYHLTLQGCRVLLIDADPQASLTDFMGLDRWNLQASIYDAFDKIAFENTNFSSQNIPIVPTEFFNLDILPSCLHFANADLVLLEKKLEDDENDEESNFWKFTLQKMISFIIDQYDYIMIDCSPSLTLTNFTALVASTHVVIPVETQYKAYNNLGLVLEDINKVRKTKLNRNLKIAGILPTKYHKAHNVDRKVLEAIQDQFPHNIVLTPIPYATIIAESTQQNLPLHKYAPNHNIVKIFQEITEQIKHNSNSVS
ncbi:MAG: ParA family protein [Arthrospira sp. SH-MAG29]|nr:ParA family protein [Arthrospira sp. SH-MAG29]MBS0015904.1 ParA family protein [Arthrospira sp. SH-MAG29]